MPRGERPLEGGNDVLVRFAADLRQLRRDAGSPTYRVLAERAHYSIAALSSAASGRTLPTLAVTLAYAKACGGDLMWWERHWHATAARVMAGREAVHSQTCERSPYAGLSAFEADEAELFFGREPVVEDVLARLGRQRAVAVFGASGAGKTSLLKAGLLPRLSNEGSRSIPVLFAPGPHPLEECALQLAGRLGSTPSALAFELASGPRALHRVVRQVLAEQEHGELIIIVDQFEEIFTLCRDHEERVRFLDVLLTAALEANSRCRVVLGIRADFYTHCARHLVLVEALRDAQVTLGPLNAVELRRAIVEPALRCNLSVEGPLLATLVVEAHGQPGQLPLLSHALLETWRRRRGNALTLAGLRAAGGIEGALARSAEAFYSALDPRQQTVAQYLLLRLIVLEEGSEAAKRPIARSELDNDADTETVLEHAVSARLLTLGQNRVEITHEALIRSWPRLCRWVSEHRDRLHLYRQLTEAAREWESLGRDPDVLFRGIRLATVRDATHGIDRGLTTREHEFLEASMAAETADASRARRRTLRLQALAGLLTFLLAATTGTTIYAFHAKGELTRQRNLAVADRLADDAVALYSENPSLALQLSLAAHRMAPSTKSRNSLLSTLTASLDTRGESVTSLASERHGHRLATAHEDHTARLWDIKNIRRPKLLATLAGHTDDVRGVAFNPSSRVLATASVDGTARLWDVKDARRPKLLATLGGNGTAVYSVAFSPDGRRLATASGGRSPVRLWDVTTPQSPKQLAALSGHRDDVRELDFSPSGRQLATASDDHTAKLWDVKDARRPKPLATLGGNGTVVFSVAFSPDGRRLATASGGRFAVRLWDVTTPQSPEELARFGGHTDVVGSVAFSPSGKALATGSDDRTVRLWDIADGRHPALSDTIAGSSMAVGAVAYTHEGHTLVFGVYDGTLRLLPLDFRSAIARACSYAHPRITRSQWARYLPQIGYRPPC